MAKCPSSEEYLAHHHILTYVEDAVTQLTRYKSDVLSKIDINRFFAQYFVSLKDGDHVMLREYEFVKATPYNRACFVLTFHKCFVNVGKRGDLLTIRDYYALVSTLCTDFPYETLQKTARIVLIDDAHDCLIAFTDFIYSFQLQLFYQEFLETSYELYQSLLVETHSPRDIVVPTDQTAEPLHAKTPSHHLQVAEGVDGLKFLRSLSQLQDKHSFSIPSLQVLKQILSAIPSVTFYGFLVALSKSEAINQEIGKLPARANIFDLSEHNESVSQPDARPQKLSDDANSSLVKARKDAIKPSPRKQTKPLRMTRESRNNSTDTSSDDDSSDSDT